jgi:chromosome segregation ATPase
MQPNQQQAQTILARTLGDIQNNTRVLASALEIAKKHIEALEHKIQELREERDDLKKSQDMADAVGSWTKIRELDGTPIAVVKDMKLDEIQAALRNRDPENRESINVVGANGRIEEPKQ